MQSLFAFGVISAQSIEWVYIAAALCFILGIKRLSGVKTARAGNPARGARHGARRRGHARAPVGLDRALDRAGRCPGRGSVLGFLLAKRVPMTAMPELVAFFNGLGGAASMFVALAEVARHVGRDLLPDELLPMHQTQSIDFVLAVALSVLIGGVTLSGSLIAYGKLAGKVRGMRLGTARLAPGQRAASASLRCF